MVGRGIGNSSRNKGKYLMGVKWKGLIRGLVFRGGWGKISCSVHIMNHDIFDTINRAPEAKMAVLRSRKTCRIRAGVQRLVDKKNRLRLQQMGDKRDEKKNWRGCG